MRNLWPGLLALIGVLSLLRGAERLLLTESKRNGVVLLIGGVLLCGLALRHWQDDRKS